MNVYEARHAGREYCNDTEGSDHYKNGGVEPIDLMIAKGIIEDFCIGNMVKYATRFKLTRNLVDLKKVSDYAHILCGVELGKTATPAPTEDKPVEPWGEEDEVRAGRLFKCRNGSDCVPCPMASFSNRRGLLCSDFFKAHPAEARKIMDEMEVSK